MPTVFLATQQAHNAGIPARTVGYIGFQKQLSAAIHFYVTLYTGLYLLPSSVVYVSTWMNFTEVLTIPCVPNAISQQW